MKIYSATDFNANFDSQDAHLTAIIYKGFENSELQTVAYEVNDGHVSTVIVED
jgi:hypothetical protein